MPTNYQTQLRRKSTLQANITIRQHETPQPDTHEPVHTRVQPSTFAPPQQSYHVPGVFP